MINITNKSKCSGCFACANACPKQCIGMINDGEGFYYPRVDKSKCINCEICEKTCPIVHPKQVENIPIVYAAYNKNEEIRLDSSSGGIFTLLAECIINQGGVVFGACFNDNFDVIHSCVDCVEKLSELRGSKYIQSKIDDTYIQVKEFLENDRKVLFTGTPCQIGGLKMYLGKDYNNLYCQDIICHGVPSPTIWDKYVDFREKQANSSVQKVSFRQKNDGWKKFSVSFKFNNSTEYRKTLDKDLMMIAFLRNTCLRPSCYNCSFKSLHRQSDVTLADFWGIQNIMPDMDDDKGTSLLILNSDKGRKLFESIKKYIEFKEADLKEAIKYNSSMISSAAYNSERQGFFEDVDDLEFDQLVKKYCTDNYIFRGKRKVHQMFSKIKHLILK